MLNLKRKKCLFVCFLSLLAFESLDSFPTVKFLYHWWTFLIPVIIILKCLLRYTCIGWIQSQRFYGEAETQIGRRTTERKRGAEEVWILFIRRHACWLAPVAFLWTTSLWNLAQAELEASQSSTSNSITKLQ